MLDLFRITKQEAIRAGFTHEGTLYGVPAYFAGNMQSANVMAMPKVPILHWYCMLAEMAYDAATYFMSTGELLVYPLKIEGRIK
ncbi:MAG: hypothetical protein ACJ72N_07605 [Labedaea sp.]